MDELERICLDNEYFQNPLSGAYFQELEDMFRSGGIVIPLTYNDPGEGKNFVNGTVCYFLLLDWNVALTYFLRRARLISTGTLSAELMTDSYFSSLYNSLDSYPQGFDCSHPESWAPIVTNYHDYHEGKYQVNGPRLSLVEEAIV